jgi:G:T-mismatch repair DNA endonuclease (very short patch repair protein)
MKMEHRKFIDSICFLPFPLGKLSGAFGLTASKSWYPHYFNTMANLDYVGQIPDYEYYGVNEMVVNERTEFLSRYEEQKSVVFNNRQTLESYCQDDVTVLRQACQVFRNEFMGIAKVDVFQESVAIASACNKVLRKLFLKPHTIGLIPTGGYTGNKNYSRKAMMWLVYREQTDECRIRHGRNGREYRLPELPNFSVDGFCEETNTVYEFNGCYWHGHPCQPVRDTPAMAGDTLAERYEKTMARLPKITEAGYQVEVQWECEFVKGILAVHPELEAHPIGLHEPLNTRYALYGVQTEAMWLH